MINLSRANLLIYEVNCRMIDSKPSLTPFQRLMLKGAEHERLCREQFEAESGNVHNLQPQKGLPS